MAWQGSGKGAVAFAGVGAAFAVKVEGVVGGRPLLGGVPLIFIQCEVADAGFGREFAGVFEPVIEPAKMEVIGVEVGGRAKVQRADAVAPWDMDPGAGEKVLIVACMLRTGTVTNLTEPRDTALQIGVIPARDVQCGNFYSLNTGVDVHLRPVLTGLIVIEPVGDIGGEALRVDCRVGCGWGVQELRGKAAPRSFERIAGVAELQAAGILLEHLDAPA